MPAEAETLVRPQRATGEHFAVAMLIIATIAWGMGFMWAKDVQLVMNRAGPGEASTFGPLLMLASRFFIAGVLWMLVIPSARRGWNRRSADGSIILGFMLTGGLILQHTGLDRTSEAVTAFLTSLSVVFVPLLTPLFFRRWPTPITWIGVTVATLGVWRMTGGAPRGFGAGELLGLSCAVVFSFHLLALSRIAARDNPARLVGGQFLIVGIVCGAALLARPAHWPHLNPANLAHIFTHPEVVRGMILMIALPSLVSFGLMMYFQPRIDPTRAVLIYLLEPIWAGAFAWIAAGRAMTWPEIQGAVLILVANAVVELLGARAAARYGDE